MIEKEEIEEINFYSRKEDYGWLSNFWRCVQTVDGLDYDTNEHYYQSMKTQIPHIQAWIKNSPSPYLAMIAGRSVKKEDMVNDWESKKVDIMKKGLKAKFKNTILRIKLLQTGNDILHEDSPTDMFWGKKGKDMLGKLLMQVRDEIRKENEEITEN
jgi:ribA/ribD-fused uncharacterized protein